MSAPLINVGALQYLGGAIIVYAHAECVAVATFDQVGLQAYRPASLERLPTAEAVIAYAAHVSRAQPQLCALLCALLCQAWRAHEQLATEAQTVETTAVVLDGVPS